MWKIIDYTTEYFDKMLEMTVEYYGKNNDISNKDFIQHEYFQNPAGKAFIKIAYDSEKQMIAGQYITIPQDYMVNGKTYKTVLSLNTLTRESYRGQQVFTKLAEEVYNSCQTAGVLFCYGAPNPNSFPGFIKKLKFKNIGEIPLYLKLENPFRIICDRLKIHYNFPQNVNIDISDNKTVQIKEINHDNISYFDLFWEKIKGTYDVIGVRDAKYMKWRYIDIPRRNYILLMAFKRNEPCGYIVGRIAEVADMRCGMLVDFLFDINQKEIGQALLDSIKKYFKKQKVGLLGCLMQPHTKEAQLLRKNGFFRCPKKMLPQPFPIILRMFNSTDKALIACAEDFERWFFTMGDYDAI